MAKDNKVRMPSSSAGITQYWDESTTKFKIKPEHVVILIIIVIILEAILQFNIF